MGVNPCRKVWGTAVYNQSESDGYNKDDTQMDKYYFLPHEHFMNGGGGMILYMEHPPGQQLGNTSPIPGIPLQFAYIYLMFNYVANLFPI